MNLTLVSEFESAADDDAQDTSDRLVVKHPNEAKVGRAAESRFESAANALGWIRVPTSVFDDRVRRIDCVFKIGSQFLVVDVKAAKKLARSDANVQFQFHWLELHKTGSLCSGESKMLALEIAEGKFALFDKAEVRQWILPQMEGKESVSNSRDALMRPYSRAGKVREVITLVDVGDMMHLCRGTVG